MEDRPKGEIIEMQLLLRPAGISIAVIDEALTEWESKGFLKILKDPKKCEPRDPCVKMLKFIEEKSPIAGYLNQT